jgi:hypothetical protein
MDEATPGERRPGPCRPALAEASPEAAAATPRAPTEDGRRRHSHELPLVAAPAGALGG